MNEHETATNDMFLTETDREIFMFLAMLHKFGSGEITQDEFMEYIEAHTPPERKGKHSTDTRSREEKTAEIIDTLERLETHIRETYFTRGGAEQ
jgi:hypothetical protein